MRLSIIILFGFIGYSTSLPENYLLLLSRSQEFSGILTKEVLSSWVDNIENIAMLTLNNKGIESIESNTFTGLIRLQALNMFSNRLTFLQPKIFSGLVNLRVLNLGELWFGLLDCCRFTFIRKLTKHFLQTATNWTIWTHWSI